MLFCCILLPVNGSHVKAQSIVKYVFENYFKSMPRGPVKMHRIQNNSRRQSDPKKPVATPRRRFTCDCVQLKETRMRAQNRAGFNFAKEK